MAGYNLKWLPVDIWPLLYLLILEGYLELGDIILSDLANTTVDPLKNPGKK